MGVVSTACRGIRSMASPEPCIFQQMCDYCVESLLSVQICVGTISGFWVAELC